MNLPSDDIAKLLAALRAEAERLPATHRAVNLLIEEARHTAAQVRRETSGTLAAARDASERAAAAVPGTAERLTQTLAGIEAAASELRRSGEAAQQALDRIRPVIERSAPR